MQMTEPCSLQPMCKNAKCARAQADTTSVAVANFATDVHQGGAPFSSCSINLANNQNSFHQLTKYL